jgi:hypothetical protein
LLPSLYVPPNAASTSELVTALQAFVTAEDELSEADAPDPAVACVVVPPPAVALLALLVLQPATTRAAPAKAITVIQGLRRLAFGSVIAAP